MSENQNRGTIDFTKYDSMPTEALEEILRLDAEMPEGQESDTELLLYVMEVLAKRKRNNGHAGKTAHEAYKSFKQNYMPETDSNIIPMKTKHWGSRWFRSLTAAAAVLAILIIGSATAKAFGFNIWQAVVQWTQETFHFGDWGNSNMNNNLPYASLQEALEKGNTPAWLVPTWIPDGFKIKDIQVEQTPLKKTYKAIYANAEKNLVITVRDYLEGKPIYVEQGDGLAEEYKSSGITYYLFSDMDLMKAKWINTSYECSISGNVTIEEMKTMIDSIEKG